MHESSHRAFSHELQNIFLCFEIFFLYFLVFGAEHNHAPFKISRMGKGTTGSDIFQGSVMVWATGSCTLQNVCVLKKVHWLRGFVCKSLGRNVCFSYADSKKIKKKKCKRSHRYLQRACSCTSQMAKIWKKGTLCPCSIICFGQVGVY